MKTLIEAFEYLSKLGIYHKNINPECFMIDSDSNIKITDFRKSVCKNIPENDNNTCQSPIIGNKHYMAPEILSRYGDKETFEYSLEKSDVFSLGLIKTSALFKFFCVVELFNTFLFWYEEFVIRLIDKGFALIFLVDWDSYKG